MIDRLVWPKYHLEDFAPYNGQPGQRRHPLKLCSNKGVVIDDVGHLAIADVLVPCGAGIVIHFHTLCSHLKLFRGRVSHMSSYGEI